MKILLGLSSLLLAGAVDSESPTSQPVVEFVTTPPTAETKITVDRTQWSYTLPIQSGQPAQGIRVETTPLAGPRSTSVPLTCTVDGKACSAPFDMPANGQKQIQLSATLARTGTYQCLVTIVSEHQRQKLTLTISRTARPFPLVLDRPIEAAASSEGGFKIRVPLREIQGEDAMIKITEVALSRQLPGQKARQQVTLAPVLYEENKVVNKDNWPVKAWQLPVLTLNLSGLDETGEYFGRLDLSAVDTPARLELPFRITVKYDWPTAAFWIGLGVLLSFAFATVMKGLRPRLQRQRAAALLKEDLEQLNRDLQSELGALQPDEASVLQSLAKKIDAVAAGIALGTAADSDSQLSSLDAELSVVRRWINARRRAQAISPPLPEVQANLEKVKRFLLGEDASTLAEIGKLLDGAYDSMDKALQADLQRRSDQMRRFLTLPPLAGTSKATAFEERLEKIAALDLNAQAAELAGLQGEMAVAQAQALATEIEAMPVAPLGFDQALWDGLKKQVLEQLKGVGTAPVDKRLSAYEKAYGMYLDAIYQGLASTLQRFQKLMNKPGTLSGDDLKQTAEDCKSITQELHEASNQLRANELAAAAKTLTQAKLTTETRLKALEAGGLLGTTAAAATGGAPPPAPGSAPAPPEFDFTSSATDFILRLPGRRQRLSELSSAKVGAMIQAIDKAVGVGAFIIAILGGLLLLWVGNPTWGSGGDILAALLWGTGVHQLSNAATGSIIGILNKFAQ
jgi:hypothetical protein